MLMHQRWQQVLTNIHWLWWKSDCDKTNDFFFDEKLVTEEKDKQDIIEVAKKMYRYYSMNFDEIYERTILKEMASG